MKKILILSALCIGLLSGFEAKASYPCDMAGCTVDINGDTGDKLKQCVGAGGIDGCSCTTAATGCTSVSIIMGGSNCTGSYTEIGRLSYGINGGKKCCGSGMGCIKRSPEELEADTQANLFTESISDVSSLIDLSDVFESEMDERRADAYFGWADSNIRSPTAGRTVAAKAKLDACLFHTDTDWIETNGGSSQSEKHATCVGTDYGCGNTGKNEHCNATGLNDGVSVSAYVCKDRCDCVYAQGTCAGL